MMATRMRSTNCGLARLLSLLAIAAIFCAVYAQESKTCAANPCYNEGSCVDLVEGGRHCTCSEYWEGDDCERDVDECAVDNGGCGDSSYYYCYNIPGGPPSCLVLGGGAINSDPHFAGFMGQKFDVNGKSGSVYSLISDEQIAVNARFSPAYTTGAAVDKSTLSTTPMRQKGTWISEIAYVVGEDSIIVSTERSPLADICPDVYRDSMEVCFMSGRFRIQVNGVDIVQAADTVVGKGVKVSFRNYNSFGRMNVTSPMMDILIDFVPPPKSWNIPLTGEYEYSHLNLQLPRIALSHTANGILGVTSRLKVDTNGKPMLMATGPDGEGIIDGTVEDYELASISDTAFKFSQFAAQRCGQDHSCASEERKTFLNGGTDDMKR